jgi:hypothetical protein
MYMFNKENKPRRSSEDIHWRVGTERHYPEDSKDGKEKKTIRNQISFFFFFFSFLGETKSREIFTSLTFLFLEPFAGPLMSQVKII